MLPSYLSYLFVLDVGVRDTTASSGSQQEVVATGAPPAGDEQLVYTRHS